MVYDGVLAESGHGVVEFLFVRVDVGVGRDGSAAAGDDHRGVEGEGVVRVVVEAVAVGVVGEVVVVVVAGG